MQWRWRRCQCGAFFSPFGNITCGERVLSYSENSVSILDSITFSNNWIKDRSSCFPIAKQACQWQKLFLNFKSSVIKTPQFSSSSAVHYVYQAPMTYTLTPFLLNMDKEQRESSPMASLAISLVPEEAETVSVHPHEHFSLPRHRCLFLRGFWFGSGGDVGGGIEITRINLVTF